MALPQQVRRACAIRPTVNLVATEAPDLSVKQRYRVVERFHGREIDRVVVFPVFMARHADHRRIERFGEPGRPGARGLRVVAIQADRMLVCREQAGKPSRRDLCLHPARKARGRQQCRAGRYAQQVRSFVQAARQQYRSHSSDSRFHHSTRVVRLLAIHLSEPAFPVSIRLVTTRWPWVSATKERP